MANELFTKGEFTPEMREVLTKIVNDIIPETVLFRHTNVFEHDHDRWDEAESPKKTRADMINDLGPEGQMAYLIGIGLSSHELRARVCLEPLPRERAGLLLDEESGRALREALAQEVRAAKEAEAEKINNGSLEDQVTWLITEGKQSLANIRRVIAITYDDTSPEP